VPPNGGPKEVFVNADVEALIARYRSAGASRVKIALTDVDGVLRGKYVGLDKFASLLDQGGGFCDCVLGWDVADQLYDNAAFTGWHTGFPDARFRLRVDTERWLPDEGVPFFLGEFVTGTDGEHPLCPRTRLRAVLAAAAAAGLAAKLGFEYEFFVFAETPHSIRAKGYRDLTPLTPGNFGYSILRASAESERFNGLFEYAGALDCPLEGLHCETGPGVWEAALAVSDGVDGADRASLFKTFAKVFFAKHGALATFMAKWSMRYPGQSGHCHFSLWRDDVNVFFDGADPAGMSAVQRHALGGLRRYLPEWLVLLAPTVNSYTRLVKGAWAPTAWSWGIENRTAALRVIPGSAKSQRLEARVPGADANPYLAAAAIIGAALLGIEQGLDPDAPVTGNAYDHAESAPAAAQFPRTLRAAAERLRGSDAARQMFGDAFVDHYVTSRLWESREYERNVNDWQLERYFEII
jgi:glutamine synthetase